MLHFIMFLIRQMTTKASNGLIRHFKQSKLQNSFYHITLLWLMLAEAELEKFPHLDRHLYIYIAAVQAQYEHSNRATYVQ